MGLRNRDGRHTGSSIFESYRKIIEHRFLYRHDPEVLLILRVRKDSVAAEVTEVKNDEFYITHLQPP